MIVAVSFHFEMKKYVLICTNRDDCCFEEVFSALFFSVFKH